MKKKSKEVAVVASDEVLAQLGEAYPQEAGGTGIFLPRLGMYSQDKTEETGKGKDKKIKVIEAAGEFYTEHQSDEVDEETGKKTWEKEELGDSIQAIIFFKRYQLRMYDESTEQYTSSPIYDRDDEVIPLFCDKKEVTLGTPAELKAKYMFTDKNGKRKSALEDNRVVYVLYNGEEYQMNFRGSSMYSLLTYERSVQAPTVLTEMSSEKMTKGDISWNKMTFKAVRKLNADEAEKVLELQTNAREAIAASKANYASKDEDKVEGETIEDEAVRKF